MRIPSTIYLVGTEIVNLRTLCKEHNASYTAVQSKLFRTGKALLGDLEIVRESVSYAVINTTNSRIIVHPSKIQAMTKRLEIHNCASIIKVGDSIEIHEIQDSVYLHRSKQEIFDMRKYASDKYEVNLSKVRYVKF